MPPVIECCVRTAPEMLQRPPEESDAAVRVYPCVERCGVCRREPFVLVDGDLHVGDDCDQAIAELGGDAE